jgi:hypothetical protein
MLSVITKGLVIDLGAYLEKVKYKFCKKTK